MQTKITTIIAENPSDYIKLSQDPVAEVKGSRKFKLDPLKFCACATPGDII